MTFISFLILCSAFFILKEAIFVYQKLNMVNSPSKRQQSSFASQGIKYKCYFLSALFVTLIFRSFSLVFISISSKVWVLASSSVAFWDFPTFLLVVSFSFFTYYLAKINIEVERSNADRNNFIKSPD